MRFEVSDSYSDFEGALFVRIIGCLAVSEQRYSPHLSKESIVF